MSLYVPMKAKEIAAVLNVPKSDRRDSRCWMRLWRGKSGSVIERQVHEVGQLKIPDRRFYRAHPRGFGFVTVEGEDEDIFIPESQVVNEACDTRRWR